MTGVQKLHLEDALDDSPQTRSLLTLFEQDAMMLKNYTTDLHRCFQRLLNAQNEISAATYALSSQLKLYEKQNLPLENDDSVMIATLKQFTDHLDEVSSIQQVLAAQLGDSMMYPINRFLQADLDEVTTMCDMFKHSSEEHESSLSRYMKHPKKKDDKSRLEVNEDLHVRRKKFHQTAMHHYSALNALQYKRKTAFLEPLIGYMHAQKAYFEMGRDSLAKQDLDDFLANINASVQGVHQELRSVTQQTVEMFQSIEKQSEHQYYGEPMADMPYIPANETLTQKAGYLYLRSKQALIATKWERCYFFIQGGNLMCQHKDQVAGSLVLDLNDIGVRAELCDVDDRRHTFQIISPSTKKVVMLQAENDRDRDEWVFTVNNIANEGVIAHNLSQTQIRDSRSGSSSSTSSHSKRNSGPVSIPSQHNAREAISGASGPPPTPPSTPADSAFFPDAPIQFDIITPSDEAAKEFHIGNKEGPPTRINPFDQSSEKIVTEAVGGDRGGDGGGDFSQGFLVRFLGSMQVRSDRGESLVHETIRQIMAARAIHNIFKMTESHLVITNNNVKLVDPSNNVVRTRFLLEDISYWATHPENSRLFGFITRNRAVDSTAQTSFACHVFECNASGEEICCSLGAATKLAFQALMEQKVEVATDPYIEKEILLANISQLADVRTPEEPRISRDGQYLLLSPDSEEAGPQPMVGMANSDMAESDEESESEA